MEGKNLNWYWQELRNEVYNNIIPYRMLDSVDQHPRERNSSSNNCIRYGVSGNNFVVYSLTGVVEEEAPLYILTSMS